MIIDKRPIRYNFSKYREKIKYIVIHDTANKNKGANALAHYNYFNGGNRSASAHYFVDDKNIIETVEIALSAWHCGDGRGRFGITNSNSIGIEICVNEDSDFEMALAQTRELIRFLLHAYNLPKSRVVRHFDASRKICPKSLSDNNWELWHKFFKSI
ncbi:MAG: peptidoglycan recognition family protein [Tissierellia bacterium]|nr:peptidoglycan recognition family protein [Tissierellia bacterium]